MVTTLNRRLKDEHLQNQIQKLLTYKLNPYKYHRTLRNITGQTRNEDIPLLETGDGETINECSQKATILNNYFAT